MYNVTHMYLPNKRSSLLLLHSRIPLIECASEYSDSLYSRIHIRIRHPVFAIQIVFVTWCIRSSPSKHVVLRCISCLVLQLAVSYRGQYANATMGGGEFRVGGGVHDSYTFQCGLVGSFTSPGIDTR